LNVKIKPSKKKNKKIDVIQEDGKIISIGDNRYFDFPTYMKLEKAGKLKKGTAEERRRLYRIRHNRFKDNKGTAGYYAYRLLW